VEVFGKPIAGYVNTPVGWVREECVHNVPNGAVADCNDERCIVKHPNGTLFKKIHLCTARNVSKPIISYRKRGVEQSYDGWLAYTTYQAPTDIDSFLGYFSVPDQTASVPEVLYLFTGLQNVDWIPIIDPEPSVFDIIQPVLQYPGDNGNYWSVKSWYVTLGSDVLTSSEIQVAVGSLVFGNMTRTASSTWFIGGTNAAGQTTSLTVTRDRLLHQPWAYNTAECYGCNSCSYEPDNAVQFTQLAIQYQGQPLVPNWVASTSPNPICSELATVNSPSAVTITFQQS